MAYISDGSWPQNKLAVVLAMCSTNRIEEIDYKLLQELKEKGVLSSNSSFLFLSFSLFFSLYKGYKTYSLIGFEDVLMVALRRGIDPTKISTMLSIGSGILHMNINYK